MLLHYVDSNAFLVVSKSKSYEKKTDVPDSEVNYDTICMGHDHLYKTNSIYRRNFLDLMYDWSVFKKDRMII